jgi:hypothetical protein
LGTLEVASTGEELYKALDKYLNLLLPHADDSNNTPIFYKKNQKTICLLPSEANLYPEVINIVYHLLSTFNVHLNVYFNPESRNQ